MRVVQQTFPTHRGTRLFGVDTHGQQQGIGQLIGQRGQPLRIVHGSQRIVDGAGADHHQQTRITALQNIGNALALVTDALAQAGGQRQTLLQLRRGGQTHGGRLGGCGV